MTIISVQVSSPRQMQDSLTAAPSRSTDHVTHATLPADRLTPG